MSPFPFLAMADFGPADQLVCARQYAEGSFAGFLSRPALSAARRHPPHQRLRLGYLSADYHEHATSYLIAEVIERHDRRRFEVSAYSYGVDDSSPMRARIELKCLLSLRIIV